MGKTLTGKPLQGRRRVTLAAVKSAVFGLFLLASACSQHEEPSGGVTASGAYMYELPPSQRVGAVYLELLNSGKKSASLNFVHTPIAETVEIHRVIYDQGMMQMRPVKHFQLGPGQRQNFAPGGYHLMLMGVEDLPAPGEVFQLTMEFDQGVVVEVDVKVKIRS